MAETFAELIERKNSTTDVQERHRIKRELFRRFYSNGHKEVRERG